MNILAIILTYNEELHIERCIKSIKKLTTNILVIDSFSNDKTQDICLENNCKFLQRNFKSHSDQFNWALENIEENYEWILRIDADEIMTNELTENIILKTKSCKPSLNGIYFNRIIKFNGKKIRWGGASPSWSLRFFRFKKGYCESRLMDEHIIVDGDTTRINGNLIDENLNSLSWWIQKHERYSSLEAIELLNTEYNFLEHYKYSKFLRIKSSQSWLKEKVYLKLHVSIRALLYFVYRYFFRFGFLDGTQGFSFHFLQGFWYRFIVDLKFIELKKEIIKNNSSKNDIKKIINKKFNIQI